MRIFLSYAGEDRALAERVQLALTGAGHEVFFDRESLPPGAEYHSRIRAAIADSELFVFLVSPDSVAPGGYCRTELKFARDKWPHASRGVLPVMARPTDTAAIPPYLSEVNIEVPEGNAAAEVLALVETRAAHAAAPAAAAGPMAAPAPTPGLATPGGTPVAFGAITYQHDRYVASPQGLVPGMVFAVPVGADAPPGAVVQLLIRFGLWGGTALLANPQETVYRDPAGCVVVWNAPRMLMQRPEAFVDTSMAVPYYVLNLAPTQFAAVYSLGFTVEAYLNQQPVARSPAVPFQVRW